MNKGFILTKTTFNYNDEVYFVEGDGRVGRPLTIFTDAERAKEKARLLNGQMMREINPMEYGYGFDEITSLEIEVLQQKMSDILDCDIVITDQYDPPWTINCRGEEHRLYRAIGADCPCQPAPSKYSWQPAVWPKGATDEQLATVLEECFDMIPPFFQVTEVDVDKEVEADIE